MNNLIYKNNKTECCHHHDKNENNKKNKINFKNKKNNIVTSLNEVEYFLTNFHKFTDYIKLYKILK